jgi:hypothetical protein
VLSVGPKQVEAPDVLVLSDDMALPVGQLRIKATFDKPEYRPGGQAKLQLVKALLAHGANPNGRMTRRPPGFVGGIAPSMNPTRSPTVRFPQLLVNGKPDNGSALPIPDRSAAWQPEQLA